MDHRGGNAAARRGRGDRFELEAGFRPSGDQGPAVASLVDGLGSGLAHQTLLGVTGSGKTFTIANVISTVQRPTLVLAPNKTLAAQLYGEMREFFPRNAVEYFVSYYDYYQPEAYIPSTDTYIEKDASINEHVEQMRLSATKALLERSDTVIVATVSAIYGLGDPERFHAMVLHLVRGGRIDQRDLLRRLANLQYTRTSLELRRGAYRVRGDVIDVYPAESEREAIRIELFDDEIESLARFDPLTGESSGSIPRYTIYPKNHYVTPRDTVVDAIDAIREELAGRLHELRSEQKLVEAQRLEQRTRFDLEMLQEIGHCKGIENYSRYLSGRESGEPPPTLFDYLPRSRFSSSTRVTSRCPSSVRCTGGTDRARRRWCATDSAFRPRSTTVPSDSTSSKPSPPNRCSCRPLRGLTNASARERWWSSSCGRPDSSILRWRCVPPSPRWTTCSGRSTAGRRPETGCS